MGNQPKSLLKIEPVRGLVDWFGQGARIHGLTNVRLARATDFYHYECNGEHDKDWGCAYRVLQSIINACHRKVPSIVEIQSRLFEVGFCDQELVRSSYWIEPSHAKVYLATCGISSRYVECDLRTSATELESDLWQHFATSHLPVMIDDYFMTYLVAGIAHRRNDDKKQTTMLLRMDPHVTLATGKSQTLDDFANGRGQGVAWLQFEDVLTLQRSHKWMVLYPGQQGDCILWPHERTRTRWFTGGQGDRFTVPNSTTDWEPIRLRMAVYEWLLLFMPPVVADMITVFLC